MKKTILSLAACAVPAGLLSAALIPEELSISTDITFASEYVFRGVQLADDSFQPTFELAYSDFYAGLWANLPTDDVDSEINYYGGFAFDLPGAEFVTFDTGLTVYHYPDTSSDRTHEIYLGALFDLAQYPALSASLYYFYDFDVESHVGEGALTYVHSLENLGVPASLDLTVFLGAQGSSDSGTESYNYYGASVELPMAVNEFSALTAGLHYASHESNDAPGVGNDDNLFWTLGYSTSF